MVTEGPVGKTPLRKSTIADKQQIPNVAVFLKRTSLEFLQILFSTRDVGSFHYDQDDTETEIQICDQHAVNLEGVDIRPAIVGARGPIAWQQIGLGGNSFESQNRHTGDETYNELLTSSIAFSCFSREGTEAEQIAHVVFNSFKFFRKVLQKYGFFQIKSLNMGAEALINQSGDNDDLYMIPVYVVASVQDRWTLSDTAAKKLEQIIIEVLTCP